MKMYESHPGEDIRDTSVKMVALANESQEQVQTEFNEIPVLAKPGDDPQSIISAYFAESKRRHDEYVASPEYKERCRKAEEAERQRAALLEGALSVALPKMSFKDESTWKEGLEKNQDPYGHAVYTFAERWARLMETRIANGEAIADCADEVCHLADNEGITGFMYGCAVSILSRCWKYGEELRRWHNLKTQIRTEGERANESGSVLNPAILTIG